MVTTKTNKSTGNEMQFLAYHWGMRNMPVWMFISSRQFFLSCICLFFKLCVDLRPCLLLTKPYYAHFVPCTFSLVLFDFSSISSSSSCLAVYLVRFPHCLILHYACSSRVKKTVSRTVNCPLDYGSVLQWFGAVRKSFRFLIFLERLSIWFANFALHVLYFPFHYYYFNRIHSILL